MVIFYTKCSLDSRVIRKPDGTPRKLLDVTRLARPGWPAKIELQEGLAETYDWFLETEDMSSLCIDSRRRAFSLGPAAFLRYVFRKYQAKRWMLA